MVDDDGVRGEEEVGEALRDLRELQPGAVKYLRRRLGISERNYFSCKR